MRTAARKDDNLDEIVNAFKDLGFSVYHIRQPVDLVVGKRNKCYLIEVKDGNKPPSEQKLTPAQEKFFKEWQGQVSIVRSVEGAIHFNSIVEIQAGV